LLHRGTLLERVESSVDPDTFEEGLVLQLFKMFYELTFTVRKYLLFLQVDDVLPIA